MSLINYSKEEILFRENVRRFVEKEIRPYVLEWEHEGRTPRTVWKRAGELGYLGLFYPETLGGQGADYRFNFIWGEEMGRCGSLGVALGLSVQTDMSTPALAQYGNEFIKETYLKPAIAGDLISSIAVTEPDSGSDVSTVRTYAKRDGDDYIINGRKMFITNGMQSDFITLLARTSEKPGYHSYSLFVVPSNIKGYSRSNCLKKSLLPVFRYS